MAGNQAFPLTEISQDGLISYHRLASTVVKRQWNLREMMQQIDIAYLREGDQTKENQQAKIANAYGNKDKLQNLTIPVIKPQIRSAVAYQAGVFLTDYPIFGVTSSPEYQNEALQLQAVIEENSIYGSWVREFLLFFQDGFKYNISALECVWDKKTVPVLETDPTFQGGAEARPRQIYWQGNCIKRWDPYNIYFDARVLPYDIPTKGEFAGHTELMSRTALKTFIQSLDVKLIQNIKRAFEAPSLLNAGEGSTYGSSFYLPRLNPRTLVDPDSQDSVDWDAWVQNSMPGRAGQKINYKGLYEVSTEYVRIVPSDFNIKAPSPNTPQVWKLIIVNHSVIIYAERQTNAHDKIPVFFGCPSEDGLGYQTKSLAQDAEPFQDISSALMNSVLAGRRRAATDRVLYDPSRVSQAHMESPNPSAKIPVRPTAYGKPVGESVFPFPFRDDQAGVAMQEIQAVVSFGNVLNGQNSVRQGQFVKGNKTDQQWENVMSNATSQDQLTALLYEAQVFTPLKEVIKSNILQYQQETTVYSPTLKQAVPVDPIALRKAILSFKITDGLLSKDKVMSLDTRKIAMQIIGSSATLAQAYNIAPMFSYIMKAENTDLTPFEKSPAQIAYEQAMMNWSQLAQLAIQKGAPFSIPQPKPQDYGYDPNMMNPASRATQQPIPQAGENSNGAA